MSQFPSGQQYCINSKCMSQSQPRLQDYSTMSQSQAASYDSSDSNRILQSLTASHYYSDSTQPPQILCYKS